MFLTSKGSGRMVAVLLLRDALPRNGFSSSSSKSSRSIAGDGFVLDF